MNRYDKGYISLYRKFKNWRFYKNDSIKAVFIHCLLSAYWKDEVITEYRGKKLDPPIKVPRGSFVTSYRKLAEELGKSVGQIQRNLDILSGKNKRYTDSIHNSIHELEIKSIQSYTIIKVCKYEAFQVFEQQERYTEINKNDTQNDTDNRYQLNNININKDKKDIKDIKDRSTGVHSNFNSLTFKLLKNGFINDDDIPEVFDEMINEFLEEYSFNHVAVVLNYVLRKTKNKQINHKYKYLKKSLTDNLAKMQKMIDQESASEESQPPIKINNEELNDLLDQLREGKL